MTNELKNALRLLTLRLLRAQASGVATPFSNLAAIVAAELEVPLPALLRSAYEAGLEAA